MRKQLLFLLTALLAIVQDAWAQTAVDLGLPSGTKWADRNVGAASATAAGTYFEWGEITAFDNNYTYSYNPTTLPMSNDAARQTWGGQWRMPTKADFQELLNTTYTTWAWTENYNSSGVKGYIISGKGAYSGNSIFMPLTGFYNGSLDIQGTYRGDYWSSTIAESDNSKAYWIGFGSGDHEVKSPYPRTYGFAVRPVQMFVGAGTEASPYQIATTTDWNNLVTAVNGGETYSGKFFKMTANVGDVTPVTTMVGTGSGEISTLPFGGTFDGDGHTLTFTISTSEDFVAPFRYINGATIKNLIVAGSNTSSARYNAGMVAVSDGTTTISNCVVSATVTNNVGSTKHGYGNSACGGILGLVHTGSVTFNGCLFSGKILGTANCFGGFVGWGNDTPTVVFNNCLFDPAELANNTYGTKTFYRGGDTYLTVNNSYYRTAFGETQGKRMRSISAGSGVATMGNGGTPSASYGVSGITAYGTGIEYGGTLYAGSGEAVSLTLTHNAAASGYRFTGYATTGGTLSAQTETAATLTMADADATVSAEFGKLYSASFATDSGGDGWSITTSPAVEGETVTVSYSGEHKVKSVTVTNKYAIAHSLAASVVGDVVGTDGNAYSVAEKDKLPVGVTAEAVVCYKSGSNGLAVALINLSGTFDHTEAVDYTGSNYTGFCTAHPVSGQTWKVLSQDEFSNVYNACGGTAPTAIYPAGGYSGNRGSLDTYITNAGGTAMSGNYWTATTYTGAENCFVCTNILSGNVCNFNYNNTTYNLLYVRYGFAF